jgi:hypothetical protein
MGKIFGLVAMLVALYVAMTLYTKGIEGAFGGAFAPSEAVDNRTAPAARHVIPGDRASESASESERRVPITDAVRERVTSDLRAGARRRGY